MAGKTPNVLRQARPAPGRPRAAIAVGRRGPARKLAFHGLVAKLQVVFQALFEKQRLLLVGQVADQRNLGAVGEHRPQKEACRDVVLGFAQLPAAVKLPNLGRRQGSGAAPRQG